MLDDSHSSVIEGWVQRLRNGDEEARKELLNSACERLTGLTRKMLKFFGRVRRWEETDDVVQNSLMRLYRTLAEVKPASAVEFYRLAALNIRRELLDLAKHYYGPQGLGTNYASVDMGSIHSLSEPGYSAPVEGEDPGRLEAWTAFHDNVERLPDEEKEVFDLLWYQELSQAEAAELLNISERTIKRRWASARFKLYDLLGGKNPEN